VPKLGYEHAAYRIETGEGTVWIDSPSAFNRQLPRLMPFCSHIIISWALQINTAKYGMQKFGCMIWMPDILGCIIHH